MGVDARMLIRGVSREAATDDQIRRWSYDLVRAVGSEHFWTRGCNTMKEGTEWTGKPPTETYSFYQLAIERSTGYPLRDDPAHRDDYDSHESNDGTLYDQDGDSVHAEPGECMLAVNLCGRWYGEGYERGDIFAYCAIAEWFEQNIPGCAVWYGGDSSGACVERFDRSRRRELRRLALSPRGRDYFNDRIGISGGIKTPTCDLCRVPLTMNGGGGHGLYAAGYCMGCPLKVETRDGGKTWKHKKGGF